MTRERIPLGSALPRAWIGFRSAPWPCVGLSTVALGSLIGFGTLAAGLQADSDLWMRRAGDLAWILSVTIPMVLLVGLLRLADTLLPSTGPEDGDTAQINQRMPWLIRQSLALMILEGVVQVGGISTLRLASAMLFQHSGVLTGAVVAAGSGALAMWTVEQSLALPLLIHRGLKPLSAMEQSRRLVQDNRLKVMALLGLLVGINLIGLMGACIGLIISLPLSALILMASCRTQTPWSKDSRRNMLPT